MNERNHDHHNPKQQAQDAFPQGRLHVNGAQDGPVNPASGGKGGGNKSPPDNGKAPPPGNGAEGRRSLPERMASLETEHKHLATKADLEQGLSGLRMELHATERRLSKKAQKNKEELQAEMRKMPRRIVVGMAALVTVVSGLAGLAYWLRGLLG